jgi:hypothetical protein
MPLYPVLKSSLQKSFILNPKDVFSNLKQYITTTRGLCLFYIKITINGYNSTNFIIRKAHNTLFGEKSAKTSIFTADLFAILGWRWRDSTKWVSLLLTDSLSRSKQQEVIAVSQEMKQQKQIQWQKKPCFRRNHVKKKIKQIWQDD